MSQCVASRLFKEEIVNKLPFKTKIGYGVGDLASNLMFQMTVIYLLFFYTDVMGIPALAAGVIFLIARLWDAVNDPVMGLIIDHTKSRHGKARVYLLYGSLPLAIATIVMFYVPNISTDAKVIYSGITYIIWGMLYTLVNIPYSSLTASLTDIPEERTSLSSIRMIFMLIGVIIVSVVTEPMQAIFDSASDGYFYVALVYAVAACLLLLLCFKWTARAKKDVGKRKKDHYKLKEIWPLLLKNKQLIIVTVASLVGNIAVFIRETAAIYYVNYNIGDGSLLPVFLGVIVISMLIANLMIPWATKKWDKKGTYLIGSVIGIIGSIIFHFIPFDNISMILILGGISSFGMAAISTLGWSMIADTVEYGEWITGVRAEGISYAVYSFSQKLATAVGGVAVAWVLEFTKYQANIEIQSDFTLKGILSTLTIIPIVFVTISAIIILFYKVDKNLFERIKMDLKTRREKN